MLTKIKKRKTYTDEQLRMQQLAAMPTYRRNMTDEERYSKQNIAGPEKIRDRAAAYRAGRLNPTPPVNPSTENLMPTVHKPPGRVVHPKPMPKPNPRPTRPAPKPPAPETRPMPKPNPRPVRPAPKPPAPEPRRRPIERPNPRRRRPGVR